MRHHLAGRVLLRALLVITSSVVAMAVALGAGEAWLRYSTDEETGSVIYQSHPTALVTLKPNVRKVEAGVLIETNEIGARDDSPPCDRPDVLLVGDSNLFAMFLPFEETLGERLEARWPGACAVNLGVPGYGPDQSVMRLTYELDSRALRPRVVVFHVFADNDLGDLFRNNLVTTDAGGTLLRSGRTEPEYALSWLEQLQAVSLVGRRVRDLAVRSGFHGMSSKQYWSDRTTAYRRSRFKDRQEMFAYLGHHEGVMRQEYERYQHGMFTAWPGDLYDYAIALAPDSDAARHAERLMTAIFREAGRATAKAGACFVALIQPSEWDAAETGPVSYRDLELYSRAAKRAYQRTNLTDLVTRAALAARVPYINLFDEFSSSSEPVYRPLEIDHGDNHWNRHGIELASRAVRSFIESERCQGLLQ